MRIATAFVVSWFALPFTLVACGDPPDDESFATLQACFDEHFGEGEGLTAPQAITSCCLEHPIAGVAPSCLDTQADCVTHVDGELDGSVTPQDIAAGCTVYIAERGTALLRPPVTASRRPR